MAVSIYDYTDYRAYLDAWFNEKKSRSVRGLASRLEISASQVSMVRSGRRNLNLEHARHWGWGLRLDDNEIDHWEAMVRAAHAPTEHLRNLAGRQLQAAQAWQNAVRRSKALEAYNHWYGSTIREMAMLPGFVPDGAWIGPRLIPEVSAEEAQRALDVLLETGQLVQNDAGAFSAPHGDSASDVHVSPQAGAAAVIRTHKAWLGLAVDSMTMPPEIRFLARAVVSLDQKRLSEIVEVVRRIHIEAAEASRSHEADTIYEIGLAVLPRTVPVKAGEG